MKLFRQKRDKSIQKNKVSKYLLYALGEIVLIIAGVFIAIQLNNLNEQKKDDKRTEKLLRLVQSDLQNNIFFADFFLPYYKLQDSIGSLIINDKLIEKDYRENPQLTNGVFLNMIFAIDDTNYKLLSEHLQNPPEDLRDALNQLKHIYTSLYSSKLKASGWVKDFLNERENSLNKNKSWSYKRFQIETPDEYFDYMANDDFFKNKVAGIMWLTQRQDLPINKRLKNSSIVAYEAIENALRKRNSNDSVFTFYKEKNAQKIIGNYVNTKDSSNTAKISFKKNALTFEENGTLETKFYPANDSLFRKERGTYFYTFKIENDSVYKGFRKQNGLETIYFKKVK